MLLTSLIISHQQNLISQLLSTPSNPLLIDLLQQHQQQITANHMNMTNNNNNIITNE